MNPIERGARAFDRFHERHPIIAFPYAVMKKFSDDQAGGLAAQMTYYGFLAMFPLLLVLTMFLGLVIRNDPTLQSRVLRSALAQFPIIGPQIRQNIHSLSRSGLALALGLVGSLYGALGAIRVTETAMNTVWDVPRKHWPNFFVSIIRALGMLVVFSVLTVASALASGIGAGGNLSVGLRIAGITSSLALNLVLFLCTFRILTARHLGWKDIWVGAVGAAAVWTALESAGGIYVSHVLRHSTELYGFFGIVIALLVWIYLGAQITLYGAETNVVRAKHLWPRRMVQPPLNEGDERALRAYAMREERRPEEHIQVRFDREATPSGPGQ